MNKLIILDIATVNLICSFLFARTYIYPYFTVSIKKKRGQQLLQNSHLSYIVNLWQKPKIFQRSYNSEAKQMGVARS